ncbi:MAG: archaellin/type IV pilin N-terminal domain-containing protein [Nanoarchaeota archaeon]
MFKKGVSPVVATVLLIVIVIVLATIIFIWAKGFLSESATKGDRVVESSCEDVNFKVQIASSASQCSSGSGWAIDINNIGNVPIYGIKVLKYDDSTGSIDDLALADETFVGGTVTVGRSSYVCMTGTLNGGDKFRIIPKLLAEKDSRKIAYTCPEKDGQTIVYT